MKHIIDSERLLFEEYAKKEFVQQLKGRARFCRDRGEIKTPELLERAAQYIESSPKADDFVMLDRVEYEAMKERAQIDHVRQLEYWKILVKHNLTDEAMNCR